MRLQVGAKIFCEEKEGGILPNRKDGGMRNIGNDPLVRKQIIRGETTLKHEE